MPERTSYEPGTPSWVDVSAPDIDATLSFYESLFGWKAWEAGSAEETGGYRMLTLNDKYIGGAMPAMSPEQPAAWTTYMSTADADATAAKVKEAGGTVIAEPMDVMTAGRMAVFSDPSGAVFAVWQPGDHPGAQVVNEPVSLTWNELATRDTAGAAEFYGSVFGWEPESEGMEGYQMLQLGENRIGGLMDMGQNFPAEVPPHWVAYFAVADADATAARSGELGGSVLVEPMDIPVGRMAMLADVGGASFGVVQLTEQPG